MKATRIGLVAVVLLLTVAGVAPRSYASTARGSFDRTLKVAGPVELDVKTGSGDITVRPGQTGAVHVVGKIVAREGWTSGLSAEEKVKKLEANPPIEQNGNVIRIGHIQDSELAQNVSISYELEVPAETRLTSWTGSGNQVLGGIHGPVEANSGSGDVRVSSVSDEVRVHSGSGNLELENVRGSVQAEAGSGGIRARQIAGPLAASTGSGDLQLDELAAGDVKARTGSGQVRLHGVKGGLHVDTGSGDITVEGEPTSTWRIGAGSGNIALKIPAGASFDLDARTSSGKLTINRRLVMQGTVSRDHLRGKAGNGGVLVDLHTGSGDIELR